jgi:hypothetical protein
MDYNVGLGNLNFFSYEHVHHRTFLCQLPRCPTLLDLRALNDGAKDISQLRQRHPRHLIALHTRDVAVTNRIFDQNDFVPLLEGLTSGSGYADVRHVAG